MTKMFGIPMQNIMITLLIITGICLSSVLFIAWRNRTMFWLGVRNIPHVGSPGTVIASPSSPNGGGKDEECACADA